MERVPRSRWPRFLVAHPRLQRYLTPSQLFPSFNYRYRQQLNSFTLHHYASRSSAAGKLLLDLVLVWRRPPPRWLLRPNLLPTHLVAIFPVHMQRLAPSGRRCAILPASHGRQSPPPPANAAICTQLDPVHAPQAQRGGSALSRNETSPEAPQASPQTQQRPVRYHCCCASAAAYPGSCRVPLSGARVGYRQLLQRSYLFVWMCATTPAPRHQLPTRLPRLPVQQPSH